MLTTSRFFASQARKPKGLFGRFVMSKLFDKGNFPLNTFVRETLNLQSHEQALEIGFGTGLLINALSKNMKSGCIHGIDVSPEMVSLAKKKNRDQISAKKVKLKQGDFNRMTCPKDSFDLVFTVNTLYFWESPQDTLAKIASILKPGGRLVIGFHDRDYMEEMQVDNQIFTYYTAQEVEALVAPAFKEVYIRSKRENTHFCHCAVAHR